MREPRPASRGRWGKDNFFCRRNYRAESLSPFPGGKVSFVNHSRPTRAATTTSGLNCRAGTVADLPACFPALSCLETLCEPVVMDKPSPNRRHLKRIPVWIPRDQTVIYFVTLCCDRRRQVFTIGSRVRILLESLLGMTKSTHWKVPQICIMPDHVHLMMMPMEEREQSLSRVVQRWKSSSQQRFTRAGLTGRVWQREFFDHLLRSDESLTEKWRYIEMNPVRAGLAKTPAEYPYLGSPDEILQRLI